MKIPIAQMSNDKYTGHINWPIPEVAKKSKRIYFPMKVTLMVRRANVSMMMPMNNSLFF